MLGHVVRKFLISQNLDVWASSRISITKMNYNDKLIYLDARGEIAENLNQTKEFEFIINCIGVIKPNIDESNPNSILNAIEINSRFPHLISKHFNNSKILQIATDCVYSGTIGNYNEESPHDPTDVYGKTKSLGEVTSSNFMNLRTSIIGRELNSNKSLWNWIKNQEHKSELSGFTDHKWNGVTTLAFAKVVYGIIHSKLFIPHTQHVLPVNTISKDSLLKTIAHSEGRTDIAVKPVKSHKSINRTLSTLNEDLNQKLWFSAGYNEIPSVEFLVHEFSTWYQ
jgi:dTDP-4-dehydrorhamnose reductase